jgi:hypothetical protein
MFADDTGSLARGSLGTSRADQQFWLVWGVFIAEARS